MITICLATFNGEKYLKEQLDSLFEQTYKDWKLLIHDDNSIDNTVNIIYEYMKKFPDKIDFFDDDISYNSSSANFSFLIEQSTSEYVMFCDQDDVWDSDKIEMTLAQMKKLENIHLNKAIMVFSDLILMDKDGNVISKSMWKSQKLNPKIVYDLYNILALNVVSGCTIMINKIAKQLVIPIPHKYIQHDHWIAVNIVKYGYVSFINKPLISYRQHSNNTLGINNIGIYYFLRMMKRLLTNWTSFTKKYSYFDFKINIYRVLMIKFFLNVKRLFS